MIDNFLKSINFEYLDELKNVYIEKVILNEKEEIFEILKK